MAAILRINYKSDFILTLHSDAGWATPFCLKFWTGAPSKAYFAGFDGEHYTHCAPDAEDPLKLVVQFDDHHLPVGDLKFQVSYHFAVVDFPHDTEDEVLNTANITTEIDGEQAQVMLDFSGETAPEIEFSLPAYAAEAQRIANEQARIAHEAIRIANEESRIAAETTRQQNETQRINNEAQRIRNEEARIAEFAQIKAGAIEATNDANSAADLANEKAQLAADKAALADEKAQLAADKASLAQSAATLATEKAQLATDKAALAQSAATLANDKATLAQQKAEYATAQGDYAKEQGDYAKSQAGLIPSDVMRTASDAAFVNANNEALFYMRQADEFLAGLMTSAEHNKLAALPPAADLETGIIYDVSALHPTSGVSGGSTYASLSAALAVIPQAKRKGGMSVKFVLSSDNNYVQYLYMSSDAATVATFTNTVNWQKMNLEWELDTEALKFGLQDLSIVDKALSKINGAYTPDNRYKASALYKVSAGDKIVYNGEVASQVFAIIACFDISRAYLQAQSVAGNTITTNVDYVFTVPSGVSYVAFCARTDNGKFKYIQLNTLLSEEIDAIREELPLKFAKSDIVQVSGSATDKVMSQQAVTDYVNDTVATEHGFAESGMSGIDMKLDSVAQEIVGKAYLTNGTITIDSRYDMSSPIHVSEGDKFIYNGEWHVSTNFVIIACFDSNGNMLLNKSVLCNAITTNVDYEFTVPAGISSIVFSMYVEHGGFNYVIKDSLLKNLLVQKTDIVQSLGNATDKVVSQKVVNDLKTSNDDSFSAINNHLSDVDNDLIWHTILADELLQGNMDSMGAMNLGNEIPNRVVSFYYYQVPKSRKTDMGISGTLPTTVRFIGYDKDGNFVKSFSDITTFTDGNCSLDVSGSPTVDSVRFMMIFSNDTTPASLDGKIRITMDKVSGIEKSVRERDYYPTSPGVVEPMRSRALKDGLPFINIDYTTYVYTDFDAEFVDISSQTYHTNYNHVSFFNDTTASAETLISAHDYNRSADILHLSIPVGCKMIMVSNYTIQGFDRFEVVFRKKNITTEIAENAKNVSLLQHNGVRVSFDNEATRVTNEAIDYDCDLRFLVFADPHNLDAESYLKYNAINEKGVVDFILGVGDYNPYVMIERSTLKQGINKVLTLAGKKDNCIYAVGNHDVMANFDWIHATGEFASVQPEISTDYIFTKKEQFEMTARHISNRAVFNEDDPYGCYYYIDFEPQKVRVIVLNSSDVYEDDGTLQYFYIEQMMFHQAQISWYANKALDLSEKSDSGEWTVMVVLHHYYISTCVQEILAAAMNGTSINKSWSIKRRKVYDETIHKYTDDIIQDGVVTITINKDYSTQGAINVLGIFFGHSHNDVTRNSTYGFKTFEFVSDNETLSHLVKAPIANGLAAGDYWFETEKGNIVQLNIADALPDARSISYNKYFDRAGSTRAEVHIYDDNGQTIWFKEVAPTVETGTGTEITGFVDSETDVTLEKCSIVCVNKDTRTIKMFPYGGADYREVNY